MAREIPTSLSTRHAAGEIGMTPQFVRDEIRAGAIDALVLGSGARKVFRIERQALDVYKRQHGYPHKRHT